MSSIELGMSGDITGELNFFSHTTDGSALWYDLTPTLGKIATNAAYTPVRVIIHDLRGKENTVDLEINGFEVHKYDGQIHDTFENNSEIQQCYYEEIANVLKNRLGASRVIVFNHIIRYRGPSRPADQCDPNHKNPFLNPHVDYDPSGAYFKLNEILGEEEAKKAMQKHFQFINVWRPLGTNPIINIPLTICDYRSLDPVNDFHAAETRGSKVSTAVYMMSHNIQDTQKWYYLSEMRSDEMFIFKIFESNPDVVQFGAHTAFINEHVPSADTEQYNIDVRCLVLYDE